MDHCKLISVPVHKSPIDVGIIITVQQLDALYQAEHFVARRRILGGDIIVTKQGFVNTTAGAVLTCDEAMKMTAEKSQCDAERLSKKPRRQSGVKKRK